MIVVSDTSPISSLFLINQLQLLPDLFGSIILPKKVMEELLLLQTDFGYDLSPVFNNEWLMVREVNNREAVVRFQQVLDAGESLVKLHLEALKTKANFYIHEHLYQKILRQAGEV
jgi:uncharacterized protein